MIACVYAPYFVATIEQAAYGLGATRPLVVCADTVPRIVMASCERAHTRGVRTGMSDTLARAYCPDAAVVLAVPERYTRAARDITALLSAWSTRVGGGITDWRSRRRRGGDQYRGAGWWFVDLGACTAAATIDLAPAIRAALITHAGIAGVVAIAPTRFSAWCAAVTEGTSYVAPSRSAAMLAPLSIDLLPLDELAAAHLHRLGLRTLGQLATLPLGALETQLGGTGRVLRQLARGEDTDPVPAYLPEATLRAVRRPAGAVTDLRMLERAVAGMADALALRLARRNQAACVVELRLACEDDPPWEDAHMLAAPTMDGTMLRATFSGLVRRARLASGVERVDAVLRDLCAPAITQLSLLDEPTTTGAARQRSVVAALLARIGPHRVLRIRTLSPDARLAEQRVRLDEVSAL